MSSRPFHYRAAPIVVMAVLLASPVIFFGAIKALGTNSNRVIDWLPRSFEETQRLLWFVEHFGSDELLAIGWDGCNMDDPRVDQFVQAARALSAQCPLENDPRPIFREVTSGRHVLQELSAPPLSLPETVARKRMADWIIGPDGKSTCIVARINPLAEGGYDRKTAYDRVEQIATDMGIPPHALRIAGPTADSVAIDEAGAQWTAEMGVTSLLLGCILAWLCLRQLWDVLAIFITAVLAAATSLAIVYYGGCKMDSVLMTMPALVFVLATSGGIHLTHYFRESLNEHEPAEAPYHAIRIGWIPCTLACLTTTIGLASLAVSRVTPVIRFGTFSAIGVAVCVFLLLVFWPSLMHLLSSRVAKTIDAAQHKTTRRASSAPRREWWEPLFLYATSKWQLVLGVAALGVPVLALGLSQTNTSVHIKDLLPQASNLLTSYGWLQDKIGPLVPVEVVLSFPSETEVSETEVSETGDRDKTVVGSSKRSTDKEMVRRAAIVEMLRQRIDELEQSGGTVAATTFAPELPLEPGVRNVMLRRVVGRHLAKNRDRLVDVGFVRNDEDGELWRISTRVSSDQQDYSVFLNELDATVADFLTTTNADLDESERVSAKICGAIPLIQMAQRQLLSDLIQSFLMAFVLIGLTMIVMLRRPSAGLLSMIPNVFPTIVIFGVFGLMRKSIDIGTMMTASVALGVAVDDTLHFLFWVRKAMQDGKPRLEAIRQAFQRSATAMLQTSMICGIGLVPFVVSPFGPLSRFAGVMFALLMAALIGDLLLLPALVASPLGRFFAPKNNHQNQLPQNLACEPNLAR